MAENIFDKFTIERVDLNITIGPKTFKLSGDNNFLILSTRNKTDLFFLLKEIVKKIGLFKTFILYTKFPGKIRISINH